MRIAALLCLLPFFAVLRPGTVLAQVTTNDKALEALTPPAAKSDTTPAATAETATSKPAAQKPAAPHRAARKPAAHPATRSTAHAGTRTALPAVPTTPPPNPVIAPPPPVLPQHAREAPPPVPVKADAIGTVTKIDTGTRLTFGPGSSDLNDTTHAALIELAAAARQDKRLEITLTAWAPGTPEDPSTPRRLSLDRALAARAVLIHEGVDSERITAIAKGFTDIGGAAPDRLDIVAAHPRQTPTGQPK